MFYVGQKVVCVDEDVIEGDGVVRLVLGKIYQVAALATVTEVIRGGRLHPRYSGETGHIHLQGVVRPNRVPYAAARFRPVVERKTDISIFTAMLNPSDKRVDA